MPVPSLPLGALLPAAPLLLLTRIPGGIWLKPYPPGTLGVGRLLCCFTLLLLLAAAAAGNSAVPLRLLLLLLTLLYVLCVSLRLCKHLFLLW